MSTYFAPIALTLRTRTNSGDVTKGSPLSFNEGDSNIIALKGFTETARIAINDVEVTVDQLVQQQNAQAAASEDISLDLSLLTARVSTIEGYNTNTRLNALETYIPTINSISSTVASHTTKISNLETSAIEYAGTISGGSTDDSPVMLDNISGYRTNNIYRVESSGWFGRTGVLFSEFANYGDFIIAADDWFHHLPTSPIMMHGSASIVVTKNPDVAGQGAFTRDYGWTYDLSEETKTKIESASSISSALDTRVTILEEKIVSPFNYIGTAIGGTEIAPTDVTTFTKTTSGSYYKVSTEGFFQDSSGVKFAKVNDGLLFNSSGTVDIVDNTDPVTSGTTDFIDVSGNTNEGFVVDISETFKDRLSSAESSVGDHETRIGNLETTSSANTSAISDHETRITTLESSSTSLLYATKASGRASFTTTDPDQIVDSFDSTVLKTAKYVLQAELTDGSMHASEILITNNGTTVYLTEYAKLNAGTDLLTYTADFNGTLIELYATPVNTDTTITFARTAIKKV